MLYKRTRKINVTCYLTLETIDFLDELAKTDNCSRNTLLEEAVCDFLMKKKNQIAESEPI